MSKNNNYYQFPMLQLVLVTTRNMYRRFGVPDSITDKISVLAEDEEVLFAAIREAEDYLDSISKDWKEAFKRLKSSD